MLQRSRLSSPPSLNSLGAVALFLDFDGTLVEIAKGPDAIEVPGDLGARLNSLAARLEGALAIVTGRSIDNLSSFVGLEGIHLAGSHGGHILDAAGNALREAEAMPDEVRSALSAFAQQHGLLHERKTHGDALHYRSRPDLEDEALAFARTLADEHGLATKPGKCVIELVRPGIDKGGAVELLAGQIPFVGVTPVFIGDDVTDEDGFAACNRLGGFGILVGDRADTVARYRLENVGEVYRWLSL